MLHSRRRAGHTHRGSCRAAGAGAETAVVEVFFRRTFAKDGEFVSEREHKVARHSVVFVIGDIVGSDGSRDVKFLTEKVVSLNGQRSAFVFEELISDGCVPEPLLVVVAFRVSAGAAIRQVGRQYKPERCIVVGVEG